MLNDIYYLGGLYKIILQSRRIPNDCLKIRKSTITNR
jgi:hypothetical protein